MSVFQFAGLDLQSRTSSARYIPPHIRNRSQGGGGGANSDSYDKERGGERSDSKSGGRNYGGRGGSGGGGRAGDFSNFYNRGGKREQQNGDSYEKDDWSGKSNSRNADR